MKLPVPRQLSCPECKWPFVPLAMGHREDCNVGRNYKLPQLVTTGHRVLAFGSRTLTYQQFTEYSAVLDQQLAMNPDLVIMHGGAQGMDRLSGTWAEEHGVATEVWRVHWKLFPPWLAPLWRNAEMAARAPQEGVAYIGPCSKVKHERQPPHASHGSLDMAIRLKVLDIPILVETWGFPDQLRDALRTRETQ